MVLLHALHRLSQPLGLHLTVAHADHGLRGRSSDADARWVARRAGALGVACVQGKLPVASVRAMDGESLEMTARRLRHQFLAEAAVSHRISALALAHHADDQAELVLLRLLRGTGSDGLGGMAWCSPSPACGQVQLIRPLLDQTKADLRAIAAEWKVAYREDASNQDDAILRNRIRLSLLPEIERRYSPAIRRLLARTAERVGADASFVQSHAECWLASHSVPYDTLPLALQRAVLRLQMRRLGHEPDFDRIERLRTTEDVQEVAAGVRMRRNASGLLEITPDPTTRPFLMSSRLVVLQPSGGSLSAGETRIRHRVVRRRPVFKPGQDGAGAEYFDADAVGDRIHLRHWQPGDRFQPLGFARPSKLQNLLVNRKVPAERRRRLLVAATASGTIFWVESLPPGERFKVRPASRRFLIWKWRSQG